MARQVSRYFAIVATTFSVALMLCAGVPWVEGKQTPMIRGKQPLTQVQLGDEAYKRGRDYFMQGAELEAKAETTSSSTRRTRYKGKALARYRASADAFAASLKRALDSDPRPDYLGNLYLEMGDALFKIGDYGPAIDAYDHALAIAPAYLRAEYGRAEAQLASNDLAAAQQGYRTILKEADTRGDAWDYVDALLASMADWLTRHEDTATDMDAQKVSAFRDWRAAQVAELADTVRWSQLESQAN